MSGFFGSGKSSFAKYSVSRSRTASVGEGRRRCLLAARIGDDSDQVLLKTIGEHIPTHAVIFDVSTDRGIARQPDAHRDHVQALSSEPRLRKGPRSRRAGDHARGAGAAGEFKEKYSALFKKDWDAEKGISPSRWSEASRVMRELDPATYSTAEPG